MPESISLALFNRAQLKIPGGVNSPVRAFKSVGGTPLFIQKANGAYVIDEDGREYIDYVGSWGPMVAGHNHPAVKEAILAALENGVSFGAPTRAEIMLAEKIATLMPSMQQIRLVNSGTEATMSALRLARGFTGRDKIIKFTGCYHGHSDGLLIEAGSGTLTYGHPSSAGVPAHYAKDTLCAPYNDIEATQAIIEAYPEQIAAIIVEPVAGNMNCVLPQPNFLSGLRSLCDTHGILLIFDEVMTGFRVAKGGAQAVYGIQPDLTTLGKVIGGGMPVGAFGGRADVMAHLSPLGPVYQAGTLSGNPIATAAGLANLTLIEEAGFYEALSSKTAQLCKGLEECAQQAGIPFKTSHIGGMFGLFFTEGALPQNLQGVKQCDVARFNRFFHHMLQQGIYLAPSAFEAGFVSQAHTEKELARTHEAAAKAFALCT